VSLALIRTKALKLFNVGMTFPSDLARTSIIVVAVDHQLLAPVDFGWHVMEDLNSYLFHHEFGCVITPNPSKVLTIRGLAGPSQEELLSPIDVSLPFEAESLS
jgi:hypothetical protein